MQPPLARPRVVLSSAVVLVLAAALAACGPDGDKPAAKAAPVAAKVSPSPGASGGAAPAGSPSAGSPSGSAAPSGSPSGGSDKVQLPTGPATQLTKARDTAAGPIMMTTLAGKKSGVTGKVWVWLPPQYNDPKYANYGFPVLTLYAGGQSNGYNTWTDDQLPIQVQDEELAKQGKAHPFIMVMPVQNLVSDEKQTLDCSDIPGQPKMGTWMSQDVPDFVRANFRTLRSRDGWGLMGASTGAFCSAKMALQHPDIYKAAVPIDGYFNPDSSFWKGHEAERLANSPDVLVGQSKADVRMLATAGGATPDEVKLVKAWVAKAAAPTKIDYYEQPGGKHLTSHFKKMIPDTLQWLTQNLDGPTAA
ncbi:alpha/beta hydrolase [Kitasatospora kifunensis]|uniref:S-formylglutathione hydrolase FrmB n=1 Tax=Kitasatospora kifunensis TaxID=58351 RepID=A0A7W7R0H6_KITKI|nr:alpha/beta hydrolase-fold protein [Kitasatospora kifunensis]MBB4922954.1 S-formylglutathione hydrolase FrmB [Kitasatospora kifunensis]